MCYRKGLLYVCPMRIYYCFRACQRWFSFPGQWHSKQRGDICNAVSTAASAVAQFPYSWRWSCLQLRKTSALHQSLRQLFHKIFALLKGFTVALPQVLSGLHVAGTASSSLSGTENPYPLFCFVFPRLFSKVPVKPLCVERIFYPC